MLVPDRAAAEWYQRVFGLKRLHCQVFDMAAADSNGPLFLGSDDEVHGTKVVLLKGASVGQHAPIGVTRVAFGAASFLRFLDRLVERELVNEKGERVTRAHIIDQWIGWTLHFSEPYGNRFALDTYDYEAVKARLNIATT